MLSRHGVWAILLLAGTLGAQPDPGVNFDAASLKLVPAWNGRGMPPVPYREGGPGSPDPVRLLLHNYTLRDLITMAYRVKEFQVSGPEWLVNPGGVLQSEKYNVVAGLPAGTTESQLAEMLRNLLRERFEIQVRRSTIKAPGYALVPVSKGHKLKSAESLETEAARDPNQIMQSLGRPGKDGVFAMTPGRPQMQVSPRGNLNLVKFVAYSMPGFCEWLSSQLRMIVIDKTALQGAFDFSFEYANRLSATAEQDVEGRDLAGAVQSDLGLQLRRQELDMEKIIVEHARRIPLTD
jgi:uncharacterized protein (TIGR03435 family)